MHCGFYSSICYLHFPQLIDFGYMLQPHSLSVKSTHVDTMFMSSLRYCEGRIKEVTRPSPACFFVTTILFSYIVPTRPGTAWLLPSC